MFTDDELRDFLMLTKKHRAAYLEHPGVPKDIKAKGLKEMDDQIKWIEEELQLRN